MSELGLLWVEPEFDIDTDQVAERGGPAIADKEIRVMARENRLAIRCDPADRYPAGTACAASTALDVLDFRLRCVAHAHPECRFRWARVNLRLPGEAIITDLVPRDQISEHPVKVTHTYGGGLKFDVAVVPVGPELSAERSTEQDVYFPKISTSGIDLSYALWDFNAVGDEPLKVDSPLRLLATVPASVTAIPVRLTLRATVQVRGLPGWIPLIGRQNTKIPLDIRV